MNIDSTSLLVVSTNGFQPGTRIKILAGKGKDEIFVVREIQSPTTMIVRQYNIFDKLYDRLLLSWHRLQDRFETWYEARFGTTQTSADYEED